MPNHSDPTSPDYDPFYQDSYRPTPKKPSRASILATNASALSVQAMAPAGFQAEAVVVPEKKRFGSTKYTTKAGRGCPPEPGATILKSEHYDYRIKKWVDIDMGADVMWNVKGRIVLTQEAGRGERADHFRRFQALGGAERCQSKGFAFLYREWERGAEKPLSVEVWA